MSDELFQGMASTMRPAPAEEMQAGQPNETDALNQRINAWVGAAMTRVCVKPLEGVDSYVATLSPFRRFYGVGQSEGEALERMRVHLVNYARQEISVGHKLHCWERPAVVVSQDVRCLVRRATLKRQLMNRSGQLGGTRKKLPPRVMDECLADIDAVVTRHALNIQGVA